MNNRSIWILALAAALLVPSVALAPAAAQTTTAPDAAVTSLIVGRLVYPPTRFTLTTTICNQGDADINVGDGQITWFAQAMPGPLRTAGSGNVRTIGSVPTPAIAQGTCIVYNTFWNSGPEDGFGAFNFGEWEFTALVTLSTDSDLSDNELKTETAFPLILAGTDVGGFELP